MICVDALCVGHGCLPFVFAGIFYNVSAEIIKLYNRSLIWAGSVRRCKF